MSGTLLTGEKKIRDTMASLLLSERAPTWLGPVSWSCYHDGQERHFCRECLRGDSPGDSPAPNRDPALSARVTTGGLSAPITRWKARCHLLWIYVSWPPVCAPLINNNIQKPQVVIMVEKWKVIFLLDSKAYFSILLFLLVPSPMTKVIVWGKSGKPLER
jgi:hypothetical protein